VRRDSTNNSNARGKHKSKGTNIEKFKRILTRLIISFNLGKKDIDDDWNWSSNLANFFIRLHDFLYPCL
jgi:hypothetical protein